MSFTSRGRALFMCAASQPELAALLLEEGAHRVIAYHSSFYRARKIPSLGGLMPWGSANKQSRDIARDLTRAGINNRLLTTVCANDPLIERPRMLDLAQSLGVAGVLNAPTVGLLEGGLRQELERLNLGMSAEMRLISEARDRGLEAWAYVFDSAWVSAAINSGATGLVLHLGITGATATGLSRPIKLLEAVSTAALLEPEIPLLLHGGALATPGDFGAQASWLRKSGIAQRVGFMAASAVETAPDPRLAVRGWMAALSAFNDQEPHLMKDQP